MNSLKGLLSQNRAEEIGFDLWNDFVVPPYYDSLDLFVAKKPRIFVGGFCIILAISETLIFLNGTVGTDVNPDTQK